MTIESNLIVANRGNLHIESNTQEAFGNIISSTGHADNDLHLHERGQEDGYIDLYYFGGRWYDPELGRWLSSEPLGLDGPNLYHFNFNDPVNGYDPNGLFWIDKNGTKHYTSKETQAYIDKAFNDTVMGPYGYLGGLINGMRNHAGWFNEGKGGPLDIKNSSDMYSKFCLNGREVRGDYFGNYLAGYAGSLYGSGGYLGIRAFGIYFQALGIGNEPFNFDIDSVPAVNEGAVDAWKRLWSYRFWRYW